MSTAETTPPVGSQDLALAAHWQKLYRKERKKCSRLRADLKYVRGRRDYYKGLVTAYSRALDREIRVRRRKGGG